MGHGRSRLDVDMAGATGGLKVLKNIAPIETFTVNYVDGEDKEETRLVFRIRGTKQFYFLFSKGTEEGMRKAAPWLQDHLEREAPRFDPAFQDAPMPTEKVTALPTGDPMGR